MEPTHKSIYAERREAYRLWFEYLRLARQSGARDVRAALDASRAFYEPWELDQTDDFDGWWKSHRQLFEEQFVVRVLGPGEKPIDDAALIIEVPLRRSPTDLARAVRSIIQEAWNSKERKSRKGKKRPSARYSLSNGAEPKLQALDEMLSIYRDVHLTQPNLKGKKLLQAVHAYYLGRKNKRLAKVPSSFVLRNDSTDADDLARVLKNLRRYIQKAERVILNAANGQFPGKYD